MGLFGGRKNDTEAPRMVTADLEEHVAETPSLPKPRNNTVIAEGVTFSGTINGEGVVQVEGVVEGQVDLKGALIVTTTGVVKGPVHAETVHIAGTVKATSGPRTACAWSGPATWRGTCPPYPW